MPNVTVTSSSAQGWMNVMMLVALVTTVFWMIVGWRAMRAHERIADAAEEALMLHRRDTD